MFSDCTNLVLVHSQNFYSVCGVFSSGLVWSMVAVRVDNSFCLDMF